MSVSNNRLLLETILSEIPSRNRIGEREKEREREREREREKIVYPKKG